MPTDADTTVVTIESPYHHGEGTLTRIRPRWTEVRIRRQRSKAAPETVAVRITNGNRACEFPLQKDALITSL